VQDALEHPCFANIRKLSKECLAENPVKIDFEDEVLDKVMLRKTFLKICNEIQSD